MSGNNTKQQLNEIGLPNTGTGVTYTADKYTKLAVQPTGNSINLDTYTPSVGAFKAMQESATPNGTPTTTAAEAKTPTTQASSEPGAGTEAKDLAATGNENVVKAETANKINAAKTISDIENRYSSSTAKARLARFDYATGDDDNARRGYFCIEGDQEGKDLLCKSLQGQKINSLANALVAADTKYNSFILMSIGENRQEKQSILPVLGDSFAAVFAGREPQVLDMNGLLPFDSNMDNESWFATFISAYSYIFRASILARYKLYMRLTIPGLCEYKCYPFNFSANLSSSQDNLIQFHMSMIVVEDQLKTAWGIDPNASDPSTATQDVAKDEKDKATNAETGKTRNPSEVGKESSKKDFVSTVTDFVNTCITGEGTNDLAKGINAVNKGISAFVQAKNAVNTIKGASNASGGSKLSQALQGTVGIMGAVTVVKGVVDSYGKRKESKKVQ